MLQDTAATTLLKPSIRKQRRKLPKRSIVNANLVSSKATDSARTMDNLLLPSEHDRIILSEIFNVNNDKEPVHSSLLPRVVLGERLNTAVNQGNLNLSRHVIIPPSTTTSKKPTNKRQAEKEEEEKENEVAIEINTSSNIATKNEEDREKTSPDIIAINDDKTEMDQLKELMAENEELQSAIRDSISAKDITTPKDVDVKERATKVHGKIKADEKTGSDRKTESGDEAPDHMDTDDIPVEDNDTSIQDVTETQQEFTEKDIPHNMDNDDMSVDSYDTLEVESVKEAIARDSIGNNLQDDPTVMTISDDDEEDYEEDYEEDREDDNDKDDYEDYGDEEDYDTMDLSEDSSTKVTMPTQSQDKRDDTQYEQECYVEIRSYALESIEISSSSSCEEDEKVVNLPSDNVSKSAVKGVDEIVQSPTIQLSQAMFNTRAAIHGTDNEDDEEEEENWMHLDTDTDNEGEDVSEKIFNLMAVKLPAAIPMETTATNKQQHGRLKRLKSARALDWIQNVHITNNAPNMADKKSRQIALKRKERLAIKRQRPYVIRKKIKSLMWVENRV
ncbi:unnamed protein product [Mucor hiemalis]